ncbi:LysR substrate-binding domain-containing protein [Hoeflea sp. TYP-13]|uniref:LysR family transcriptional regulator n=1 Tax=Hoeflea sp. TYP-13 TaxID=3230023 RepID=UPI0034C69045
MEGMGDIPVLVAVAENGGFAAAARKLGVSKSAVSKRITQLELRLGAQLFHRTTRRISLTEAGERYLVHATEAVYAARQAEDAVSALQGAPQGRLRVNTPMSFGRLHVAPLIAGFLERYPQIRIDLVMDDRTVDLIEDGFDVAITGRALKESSMIARRLAPLHSVLCASPGYISSHGKPVHPDDLTRHNCLHFAYSTDFQEWNFTGPDGSVRVHSSGNYQANNSEALREALIGGCGIARLPTFIAGPDIAAGRLVHLLREYRLPSQALYAVFPERRYMPAKVRAFIDFAVERFGADIPYWDRGIWD